MSSDRKIPDINLLSGEFWGRNPHDELSWLRANAPVYWDAAANIWGIARYDHVKEIETNPEVFSNANGVRPEAGATPMLIDLDDPAHRRRRQLVAEGFTPRRVRAQEPKVRTVVDRLIDQVCEAGECDFVWDLAAWLPLVMIGDALGVDPADHATLMTWSDDLLRGQGQTDEVLLTKMVDAFSGYTEYANRVIEDRRGCPRDDLMSVLVHAEVDGERLDDGALLFDSLLILIGGDETTRHVISGGAYQLLARSQPVGPAPRRPRARNHCGRGDAALGDARSRTWRAPPRARPTSTEPRSARASSCCCSTRRPTATRATSTSRSASTSPARPNDHVAFGFGPHFCLGSSLARIEARVMFEQLLERLPDLHLVDDTEPGYRPASFVSGYESMRVAFTPTAPIGSPARVTR